MTISSEAAWEVFKSSEQLFAGDDVQRAYSQMASDIADDLAGVSPVVVCVMNGGAIPFTEIVKRLDFVLQTDYVHVTRYHGNLTGGEISWLAEPRIDPKDRHILIVDDILDEGKTLASIVEYYKDRGAASVRSAVLVVKDRPRKMDYMADYVGLHVPNRYVFGCGMDYKGYLRNVPGIYAEVENNSE